MLSAQTVEPDQLQRTSIPDEGVATDNVADPNSLSTRNSETVDAVTEVDIQRRFNELRRELLDDRADTVSWWLTAAATFITVFGVVAVIAGYVGFSRFREIEAEASRNVKEAEKQAQEAERLVAGIEENRRKSEELLRPLHRATSEDIGDPTKANLIDEAAREARRNPDVSLLDRAVADAYLLQKIRDFEGAIEKWHSIANVTEGYDNDRAALAWFSVGYLYGAGGLDTHNESESRKAIHAYDEAIRLKSDYVEALNNRGTVKGRLGQYVDAIADFDQATFLRPDYAEAYYNRGLANCKLNLHEKAVTDFDHAVYHEPDYVAAYNNRGLAYIELARLKDAVADFDQAIALEPSLPEPYSNRGKAKSRLGQHEQAIADYDEAIRLRPDFAMAYYNRGNAKGDLGRHVESLIDYDQAIRLMPDYSPAYSNRGTANHALGRYEDAVANYDHAILLEQDNAQAYTNRGAAKHCLDRHEDAIIDYTEAICLKPDHVPAYIGRGEAQAALGRTEEAKSDFETALALAQESGYGNVKGEIERQIQELRDTE